METYLDNSATTRVSDTVAALIHRMMTEEYGNPSSLHRKGFLAEQRMTAAREQIAAVLGVRREEIAFTSCGSEANNLAVLGAVRANRRTGSKVVTTAVEHDSLLAAAAQLEKEGFQVVRVAPRSDGSLDPQEVAAQVDENTVLVSVMHVNSETGAINDLRTIARLAKRNNPKVLVHGDCVQSFGRLPIAPESWKLDLVTMSGHKIHGPKGVAALYHRKGVRVQPLYYGSAQEYGFHPGTENVPGICGFGLAAEEIWAGQKKNMALYTELRQLLLEKCREIPGVCINSPLDGAPYITNLSVPGVRSEVMIHYLEQLGIYVSSGSACSKGARSHVLTAMALPLERVDSAVRVSLCRDNTPEDIEYFCACLAKGAREIARVRP